MGEKVESVLLASGGMDSTTLAFWLMEKKIAFYPVFINGQHCMETELDTLKHVLPEEYSDKITILDISTVYNGSSSRLIAEANLWKDNVTHEDFYLPYRNLLFLTVGAAYAQSKECNTLYTAFINSNHAKEIDCSAEFFEKLAVILTQYGTVHINMPFRDLSKYEVAKIGISLHAPIGKTFSCQASSVIPCGACPNCVDRLTALQTLSDEE
jgi:7-cyano-7-deazaguanine synthase